MDFTLDTEQKALRDAVRDMLGRRVPADEIGPATHDAELWKSLAEMGLVALPFEEGAGPVEVMLVAEELGRSRTRTPYAETLLTGHVLSAAGQADLVERIGAGEALVVPALAEPSRAWGTTPAVTAAETDGGWVLTGTKDPVPWAEAATHLVVSADRGLFLVEGPKVAGSGVVFDGTPATFLGDDPALLTTGVNHATVALCAEALGAMAAALDLTVGYLKSRKQFGVPLMTFQTLSHRAANLYVQLELARSTVQYAAMSLAESGGTDPADAAMVSRTKVVVGKAGRLIGQEAIQLHGGIGVTAEYAVGHLTARLTAIERSYGDTRQHLAALARSLTDHASVDVI